MQIQLTWDDPAGGTPQQYNGSLPVTIGRSKMVDVPLSSRYISREHARLELRDNHIVLVDLNSDNGVFVGGQRLSPQTPTRLSGGSTFKIGPFELTLTKKTTGPAVQLRWLETDNTPRQVTTFPPLMLGRHDSAEVVLPNKEVSKRHATIYEEQGQWILHDENSTNGTQLNGQICQKSPLKPGDIIQIGPYELMIMIGDPGARPQVGFSHETTLFFSPTTGELLADTPEPETPRPDFPPKIFDRPLVSRGDLERTNLPLQECTYLTIGGGLGSFAWVDHLVIYGADPTRIVVIGNEKDARPYNRYRRLCQNSQIPEHERLRSNSDSCPDNIWGWPGYAVREAWQSFTQGDLQHMLKVLLQIFGEPEVETYTPRSGDVFTAIDREALRIGWPHMWRQGTIEAIRKTDDGRYVVAYSQPDGVGQIHKLHLARYVHLAIGYPAIRILPDLQSYRDQTGDTKSVVNAYERHTHVYNHLAQKGGTVVVRGRGIVASRVIQRLYELRQDHPGRQIQIVHLHRSPTSDGHRYGSARRPVENHWEFQPFNWPKANWGGDLRALLERAIPRDRKELLNDWGGTTTAARPDWRHIVRTGLAEGWYVNRFGSVTDWCRNEQGRLETRIQGNQLEEEIKLVADFIIDATGLEASIDKHPLLKDLLQTYNLSRNVADRLDVTNDFALKGMKNDPGRLYASGIITLGGPYAPVDSFLGLQYAALRSVNDLTNLKAPSLRDLNGFRSIVQWIRWATGRQP